MFNLKLFFLCLIGIQLLGCGDGGECPEPTPSQIKSGQYQPYVDQYAIPTASVSPKREGATLEVDRNKNQVKVTYMSEGKQIVETWRIAKSTIVND